MAAQTPALVAPRQSRGAPRWPSQVMGPRDGPANPPAFGAPAPLELLHEAPEHGAVGDARARQRQLHPEAERRAWQHPRVEAGHEADARTVTQLVVRRRARARDGD